MVTGLYSGFFRFGASTDSIIDRAFVWSLFSVAFFLSVKIHFANLSVAAAAFFWLLSWRRNVRLWSPDIKLPVLLFSSLYAAHVMGMFYTDDLKAGFSLLEKKLPMLALPIIVLLKDITHEDIRRICNVFILGVIVASLYCYIVHLQTIFAQNLPVTSFFTNEAFQNNVFSTAIPIHPSYLSGHIILSLVIIGDQFMRQRIRLRVVMLIVSAFLLMTFVVLMARTSFFAACAVAFSFAVFIAVRTKKVRLMVIICCAVLVLIAVAFYLAPNFKDRMLQSFGNYEEMTHNHDQINSVPLHLKSWHCAAETTIGIKILFGHGTGDEKNVLSECYAANGWMDMAKVRYDSHNEYLSSFVRTGIVGLGLLVAAFTLSAVYALRTGDFVLLSFMIIVVFSSLAESILRGQYSLLFYSFFNACLFKRCLISTLPAPTASLTS